VKKLFAVAIPLVAVVALFVASSYSCGANKTSAQETKATTVSSKSASCSAAKASEAKMTAAKECPYAHAMMAGTDMKCDYAGNCAFKTMSIKGMTCTGCEQTVTAALMKVPGVVKVASISYKDEKAVVCIDPTKCKDESCLTKAVSDKGYTAEIIPAVAHTVTTEKMDHPSCSAAARAACGEKAASCTAAKKTAVKSTSAKVSEKSAEETK
jgi:copper chaperone CopZ